MKAILLIAALLVSQAACMDRGNVIITVDPRELSPEAVATLFDAIRFQLDKADLYCQRDMQRRFLSHRALPKQQELAKVSVDKPTSKL